MRQELVIRLLSRIYADGTSKPSKVCNFLYPPLRGVGSSVVLWCDSVIAPANSDRANKVVVEFHQEEVYG